MKMRIGEPPRVSCQSRLSGKDLEGLAIRPHPLDDLIGGVDSRVEPADSHLGLAMPLFRIEYNQRRRDTSVSEHAEAVHVGNVLKLSVLGKVLPGAPRLICLQE